MDLVDPGGAAQKEKAAAIEFFNALKRGEKPVLRTKKKRKAKEVIVEKKTFEFKAYNSKTIKKALKDLFNGKCAYCESEILTVTVGDIEHYRPKAEVIDEGNQKLIPGYYWLAYDWDNLLLSCNNCNRKTTQEVRDAADESMGKGNKFPLTAQNFRCLDDSKDVTVFEEQGRLLLNPCVDHPEDHLIFMDDGAIKAKSLPDGQADIKAEVSIKVYALHRLPLVTKRAELFKSIQLHITELKEIFDDMVIAKQNNDAARVEVLDGRLKRKVDVLKELQNEKRVYSGLAKQIITPFLTENGLL